jgi:hypothetical protein
MTLQIGLGETVYIYDGNRRRYDERGRIIERECYAPLVVIGETKVSWVLENGVKVNKKKPGDAVLDAEGVERALWIKEHRHKIAGIVDRLTIYQDGDYEKLRQIAEIIGYPE